MKNLTFTEYYDKLKGCYLGKNVGGTLGAPFECYRGVYNVDGFMQDVSMPIPNDDVDLQLVWLSAVEHEGRNVDSHVLAEYWDYYVTAVISEYGTGKNNFNAGIMPPLTGYLRNENRNSNGAWIRAEIWACLCAGNPMLAANYAYYDACVDHSDEGVHSAVFLASLMAAAFFESDARKLAQIGFSFIPDDCAVKKAVELVFDCFDSGDDYLTARKKLFKLVPSSFGEIGGVWRGTAEMPACEKCPAQQADSEIPKAEHGYDAPWSMGAIMIGWLYGKGDFGKSVCIATNLGEDTDCTAGSLGAILGIIAGAKALPAEWVNACSDKIATWTIRRDAKLSPPSDVSELCDRIAKQTPVILGAGCKTCENGSYEIVPSAHFKYRPRSYEPFIQEDFMEVYSCGHDTVRKHFRGYTVTVKYDESLVKIEEGKEKKFEIKIFNMIFAPQYLTVRFLQVPADWETECGLELCVGLEHWHGSSNENSFVWKCTPKNLQSGKYTVIMEISAEGKGERNYIPLTFIKGAC